MTADPTPASTPQNGPSGPHAGVQAAAPAGLREQYKAAIRALNDGGTLADPDDDHDVTLLTDAVMAVRDAELQRLVDHAADMEQRVIDLGQHREVAERARAEVDQLTALVGRYADRAVANGQRAEQTEAALARVRAAVAERRAEVAEYEAEHPPSAWSDAVTVTCDRIDDALRPEVEPQGIHDTEGQPTTEEAPAGPLA